MAFGDVTEVRLEFKGPSGEQLVNVRHYNESTAGDFTLPSLITFAGQCSTNLANNALTLMPATVQGVKVTCTVLTGGAAGLQYVDPTISGVTGSSAGTQGSIERAIVYSLRSILAGRSERGRLYQAMPCRESFTTEGVYVPTNPDNVAQAAYATQLSQPLDGKALGDMIPSIYHRIGGLATTVVTCRISPGVGIQRRRRFGVGA